MRLDSRQFRWCLTVGVLALAGCATADLRPGVVRHETSRQIREKFHGPDVTVRALALLGPSSHKIQPTVYVSDSAYVLVGEIGDDGTLRVLYPMDPKESAFVGKRDKLVVPAFIPRMFYPLPDNVLMENRGRTYTGSGHVFAIASSKPLLLEKLTENGRWSLFDVYYNDRDHDPRPAITDLAVAISTHVKDVSIASVPYHGVQLQTKWMAGKTSNAPFPTKRLPRPPR